MPPRDNHLKKTDLSALSPLNMEPVSLGRVVPHDTSQAVECVLSEVVRIRLRPMVATLIQQLASVRACLYTQHLIAKRKEKLALAIELDDCANLGALSLRRRYVAPSLGNLAQRLKA